MKRHLLLALTFGWALFATMPLHGHQEEGEEGEEAEEQAMSAGTFAGLKLRSIGPALMSGRIGDFAVNPKNHGHYFVAVCSGGVWKTINAGTTWIPVFDNEGSYSIGCLTMDPENPNVVWVGTGENNSQRSVGFGDGVYRTRDDGKTWENLGLKESEHIGATPTRFTSPPRGRWGAPAATAGYTRPPTAVRPGNASCTSVTIPASTRSTSTRETRTCSMPPRISAGGMSGR